MLRLQRSTTCNLCGGWRAQVPCGQDTGQAHPVWRHGGSCAGVTSPAQRCPWICAAVSRTHDLSSVRCPSPSPQCARRSAPCVHGSRVVCWSSLRTDCAASAGVNVTPEPIRGSGHSLSPSIRILPCPRYRPAPRAQCCVSLPHHCGAQRHTIMSALLLLRARGAGVGDMTL